MFDEVSGDLLQWLRGFYFVASSGSIMKATKIMGREQPTITRQIKCLEKELGVVLFDRSSGVMKLTPSGNVLFQKAIKILDDVQEIRDTSLELGRDYEGRIVIAAGNSIINNFLPRYIVAFHAKHPRVSFQLEANLTQTVIRKVESAEVDFGIAHANSVPASMDCYELFETTFKMITARDSSLFHGESPEIEEIASCSLMLLSDAGTMDPLIRSVFADRRLNPNVILSVNNFAALKRYVALGLGAGILRDIAISEDDMHLFKVYNVDRYFPRTRYRLLLRKRKYLSPAITEFILAIKPDVDFWT